MARTLQDAADLSRFFAALGNPDARWSLSTGELPKLRRHLRDSVASARGLLDSDDALIPVRAAIVLLALDEQPDLARLEAALLSDERRRWSEACNIREVLPKKSNPALLSLAERVAARSDNCATACVQAAILMRDAATEDHLAVLRRLHDRGNAHIDSALCRLIDHADGSLRSEGMALFDSCLGIKPRGQFAVHFFAERADDTCIPRLWSLLEDIGGEDFSGERNAVFKALVRLNAPGIRNVLLAELDREDLREYYQLDTTLRNLRALLRGTNDQEVIARIVDRFRRMRPGSAFGYYCAMAVAAIGGPSTKPVIEVLTEGLGEAYRTDALLEARGISLDDALDQLQELGILEASRRPRSRAKARTADTLRARIVEALVQAGALHRFDAESGGTPVPHDRLILDLAELSGSDFSPDDVMQEGPEDGAAERAYIVRFTFGSRSYEFRCGDQSEWFDHPAVAEALNRALDEAGVGRRFIEAGSDSQYPGYIFANPESAAEAYRRGLLMLARAK